MASVHRITENNTFKNCYQKQPEEINKTRQKT